MKDRKIDDFLADDCAKLLLVTVDRLNPITLPESRLCTMKTLSETLGWDLKRTWGMCDTAVSLGLMAYRGGMLSHKRVDLTELGAKMAEGVEGAE